MRSEVRLILQIRVRVSIDIGRGLFAAFAMQLLVALQRSQQQPRFQLHTLSSSISLHAISLSQHIESKI